MVGKVLKTAGDWAAAMAYAAAVLMGDESAVGWVEL